MHLQKYLASLEPLNPYELFGKRYRELTGKNLSFSQYIALLLDSSEPTIALLNSPQFLSKEQALKNSIRTQYRSILDENGFLPENVNIELEPMLRYVDIPAHRHTFEEYTYVLQGSCQQTVNGNAYIQTPGMFSYISSGTEHQTVASPDCVCLSIKIRKSTFLQMKIPSLPLFATSLYFDCGDDPFVRDTILAMYAQQEMRLPFNDQIIENLFETLLIYCCQSYRDALYRFSTSITLQRKMLDVAIYMYENYQSVTLHSIAEHFHYTDAYLSSQFHQYTGMTFTQVLRNYRLDQARNLLLTTNLKLNEICEQVGYGNVSRFIKDFKEIYRITPHQFRKNHIK